MPEYQHNPKVAGSNVICCVPQKGRCPVRCPDCFFQPSEETGESRAYLGPHYEYTPNIPPIELCKDKIVRINDCNDSNHQRDLVMGVAQQFDRKFYNTSIPKDLAGFVDPVVLTVNPAGMTYKSFHKVTLPLPKNLMFVRARVSTWNLDLIDEIVCYYTSESVPVVLTFMALYETSVPEDHLKNYSYRQRTMNSYWVINPEVWDLIKERYAGNSLVLTCGKDAETFKCSECRNCETWYQKTIAKLFENR